MLNYLENIRCSYIDKTIYNGNTIWLHYKGGLYLELGKMEKDISNEPLVNSSIITIDEFKLLMRLDTIPAYGKPEWKPLSFGEIVMVYEGDLIAEGIALGTNKESKRSLCECGCEGECNDDEVYSKEWHEIESDEELTEVAVRLMDILKR